MIQVPEKGATNLKDMKVDFDIKGRGPEPIVRSGKKVTAAALEGLRKANIGEVEIEFGQLEGAYALSDIVNTESGEIILESNNEITPAKLQEIVEAGIDSFSIFFPERDDVGPVLSLTLKKDVITKWKSTARCVRAIRQQCKLRTACSKLCSSIRENLIFPEWDD